MYQVEINMTGCKAHVVRYHCEAFALAMWSDCEYRLGWPCRVVRP